MGVAVFFKVQNEDNRWHYLAILFYMPNFAYEPID
jgi:hypothetical protein